MRMAALVPYCFYRLIAIPLGVHDVLSADLTERVIIKSGYLVFDQYLNYFV